MPPGVLYNQVGSEFHEHPLWGYSMYKNLHYLLPSFPQKSVFYLSYLARNKPEYHTRYAMNPASLYLFQCNLQRYWPAWR